MRTILSKIEETYYTYYTYIYELKKIRVCLLIIHHRNFLSSLFFFLLSF